MGQDNLLAIRSDRFVRGAKSNRTGQASHDRTRVAIWKALEHMWTVEITCLPRENERQYLVVVCDSLSGEVIGWAFDRILDAAGKAALRSALLEQPNATPGTMFQPPNPVLGPLRRLAPTAQD